MSEREIVFKMFNKNYFNFSDFLGMFFLLKRITKKIYLYISTKCDNSSNTSTNSFYSNIKLIV